MGETAAWTSVILAPVWYGLVVGFWVRHPPPTGRGWRGFVCRLPWSLGLAAASALAICLLVPDALLADHADDSFFTLAPWAQLLVASLALVLAACGALAAFEAALAFSRMARSRLGRALALLGNLLLLPLAFTLALSLSPQIFYSLYRLIMPGLPDQWVVRGLFDFERLSRALALRPDSNLADLSSGIAFWSLVALTLLLHVCPPKQDP